MTNINGMESVKAARGPDRTRVAEALATASSVYVAFERDAGVSRNLDWITDRLIANEDMDESRPVEARALVVTGASGMGKTTLLARLLAKRDEFADLNAPGDRPRRLSVSAPSPCTLAQLGREILHGLGYPIRSYRKVDQVWEDVRRQLAQHDVRLLWIDEMHDVTMAANSVEQLKIRNMLRSLLLNPGHAVALVLSGKPEMLSSMDIDIQLRRRFRFSRLLPFDLKHDGQNVASLIANLAGRAGLVVDDPGNRIAPRLIHACDGCHGIAVEMVVEAIREAVVVQATALTIGHFADAYALQRDVGAPLNPFLATDWRSVDTTAIAADDADDLARRRRPAGKAKRT